MNFGHAIQTSLKKVTREFTQAKMKAYRHHETRVSQWQLDRWEKQREDNQLKAAAYKVIPQCYKIVSDNGRYPANKRQIFYKVRPLVLEATGKIWKDSNTFTQHVLEDFLADNRELTRAWDIVADARGHLTEPHAKEQIGIGTLEVRGYVGSWTNTYEPSFEIDLPDTIPTVGPVNRFSFALFIEKEGFDSLLESAKIAERYDLAIFSSKGQTNIATRRLVDRLSTYGVTILVAHDFDIAGFTIAHWLSHSNDRYQFQTRPRVIDLGLRLADAERLGLQSEEQVHRQWKDPTEKFRAWGNGEVTEEEAEFLRGSNSYGQWTGQRVELNAMTSPQFIDWLEEGLHKAGVEKLVPDVEVLGQAWRRALWLAQARDAVAEIDTKPRFKLPKNIEGQIRRELEETPELSWDAAIARIADKRLEREKT